uniref:Uncharacterized protein n=1 Tax=uncultured marine group II/III euryarchaeote KM3_185_F09 TaxID=1457950 RepID=A0A075GRH3_9EURY|nr:hypothetical protein [uncultured marine group II/III euryarchaeote KM3_185_F09]
MYDSENTCAELSREDPDEEMYTQRESCHGDDCGACYECEQEKAEYMAENFPDAWEDDINPTDLLDDGECCLADCEGYIDFDCDSTEGDVFACSSCETEYRHCGTCNGYYQNRERQCPNDC